MKAPEIYEAAVYGRFDRVREILAADPGAVDARDEYGFTALHGVAGEDHVEMIALLVKAGADINARNARGHTPLHLAANPEMVRALLEAGAEIDARANDGSTPLLVAAAEADRLDVMEALLEAGASPNAKDKRGHTALDIAAARDEDDKVDLLLSFGGERGTA